VAGQDRTARGAADALEVEPTTAVAALQGPGRQGLYVNRFGDGYAIFCSTLAWQESIVRDPLWRKIHQALFSRRAHLQCLEAGEAQATEEAAFFAPGYEVAQYKNGYAMQNRTGEHLTLRLRVAGQDHSYTLPPHGVLLVKDGEIIPLGSGLWPLETGPASP